MMQSVSASEGTPIRAASAASYSTLPYVALAALVAFELAAILALNHGMLVYTLDDAYIHLALAERIWSGTYGINLHEVAAPASSIVWPFLLAPFSRLGAFTLVPLVVNIAAASLTLVVFVREVRRALAAEALGLPGAMLVIGLILATNLVPVIFTGMEHSLQQLLAVVIVAGLVEEGRTGRAPTTLWLALLFIPLVRYDSLALVAPALLYLLWRRHVGGSLTTGVAALAALACFSIFLVLHGRGLLPASVLAKSDVVRAGAAPVALAIGLYTNLVVSPQGNIMVLGFVLVLAAACDKRRVAPERGLAFVLATALALQFAFGKFGAYFRYEVALWAATLVALAHLYRNFLARAFAAGAALAPQLAVIGILGAVSIGYLFALVTTPLAANNIYDQQYQMHRFLVGYYRGPVAVNDLGWTSLHNTAYVLDFGGLASQEALQGRLHEHNSDWMRRLCQEHGVRLAMIYDGWFPTHPAEWIHVGTLKLARYRITPAFPQVEFYATEPATAETVRSELATFGKNLPDHISLTLDSTSAPTALR
jgi:hypothetical protein